MIKRGFGKLKNPQTKLRDRIGGRRIPDAIVEDHALDYAGYYAIIVEYIFELEERIIDLEGWE